MISDSLSSVIEGSSVLREKINILVVIKDASKIWGRSHLQWHANFRAAGIFGIQIYT